MDALAAASRANAAVYVIDPAGTTGRVKIRGSATLTTQTGGESFVNSNDFESAVSKIWDETSHYYLIGYASSAGHDLHDLEVKGPPRVHTSGREGAGADLRAVSFRR